MRRSYQCEDIFIVVYQLDFLTYLVAVFIVRIVQSMYLNMTILCTQYHGAYDRG